MRQILIGPVRYHRISTSNYKQGRFAAIFLDLLYEILLGRNHVGFLYAALRFESYRYVLIVLA